MEDCVVTTEVINKFTHTYYSRDGAVVAKCIRFKELGQGTECWYSGDKLHRDGGPAEIRYYEGQIVEEMWYNHGVKHRDDGPAEIWYENGQIIREFWCHNCNLHRMDGPASISYKNGDKTSERWYRYSKLCPIGTLATVIYYDMDSIDVYYIGSVCTPDIDKFRDAVKGDAIYDALRLLPLPISQAIIPHYCYQ